MALSNSQYDAIMREYGKQQMENQHSQEARKKEIEKLLSMPENAADYKKLQELTEENDQLDESLDALYEAWGQLSE